MKSSRAHLFAVLAAYAAWGILPVYWKLFDRVPPEIVVAHRAVWSAFCLAILLAIRGELLPSIRRFVGRNGYRLAFPSAVLIGINWLVYLWAISSHHVLEASLGYFICPLMTIVLGAMFLGERCSRLHLASLSLIAGGVLVQVLLSGTFPVVGLALAASFSLYALYRKRNKLPVIEGLFWESILLSVPAAGYLALNAYHGGASPFGNDLELSLLLASVGVVTVVPMALFAWGLARVSLRFTGVAQYLAPTLKLWIAISVFGEPFGSANLAGYAFVWSGIALYLFGDFFLAAFRVAPAPKCLPTAVVR